VNQAERLARVEAQLEGCLHRLDRVLSAVEGTSGIVVRLDRVEQGAARSRKYGFVVASTAIAALTTSMIPKLLSILR